MRNAGQRRPAHGRLSPQRHLDGAVLQDERGGADARRHDEKIRVDKRLAGLEDEGLALVLLFEGREGDALDLADECVGEGLGAGAEAEVEVRCPLVGEVEENLGGAALSRFELDPDLEEIVPWRWGDQATGIGPAAARPGGRSSRPIVSLLPSSTARSITFLGTAWMRTALEGVPWPKPESKLGILVMALTALAALATVVVLSAEEHHG